MVQLHKIILVRSVQGNFREGTVREHREGTSCSLTTKILKVIFYLELELDLLHFVEKRQ